MGEQSKRPAETDRLQSAADFTNAGPHRPVSPRPAAEAATGVRAICRRRARRAIDGSFCTRSDAGVATEFVRTRSSNICWRFFVTRSFVVAVKLASRRNFGLEQASA